MGQHTQARDRLLVDGAHRVVHVMLHNVHQGGYAGRGQVVRLKTRPGPAHQLAELAVLIVLTQVDQDLRNFENKIIVQAIH